MEKIKRAIEKVIPEPFRFFLTFLDKKAGLIIGLTILITVAYSAVTAIVPYFAKLQLDQLSRPNSPVYPSASPKTLFLAFLIVPFILVLGRALLTQFLDNWLYSKLSRLFESGIQHKLWEKIYDFDAGFLESERNEYLLSQAREATKVPHQIYGFLRDTLSVFTTSITIIPLLTLISPWLMLLTLGSALIQHLLSLHKFRENLTDDLEYSQLGRERSKYDRLLGSYFQALKQIGEAPRFIREQEEIIERDYLATVKRDWHRAVFDIRDSQLRDLVSLLINVFVGYQVLEGKLSLGSFGLVLAYTGQLSRMFEDITRRIESWRDINFDYFRLQFFLKLQSRWKRPTNPIQLPHPEKVELDKVTFTYPDYYEEERSYFEALKAKIGSYLKSDPASLYRRDALRELDLLLQEQHQPEVVLKNVSLKLERGVVIALLGRNGAGKTSVTRLLMHHFEPDGGKVLINDIEITKFDQQWLFRQFALLTQNPLVLSRFSLRENLLLGCDPLSTDPEIWRVLDELNLGKTFKKLSKGLDSVIGEDTRLSGGQEQLLCLARVLLQKRPFIILDEGTSQLDVEHEAKILSLLVQEAKEHNTGVLFITHRITTARKADELLVIDKGKIVERGSHAELLKKKGLYASFWKLQVAE